jgi:hypothetical protein
MATVNGNLATINVPEAVTCSLGGSSVPIIVTASAVPFADVKVSLIKSIADDEAKTDNSVGITPVTGQVVTLKVGTNEGVLGFNCAATVTGKELKYKKDGTDKDVFSLSSAVCTVTNQKAGTKPATPTLKLAMVADKSEASKTTVEGECPGLGASWIELHPRAGHKILGTVTEVRNAHTKFVAGLEGAYLKPQWCYKAVATAGAKTTCEFATASNYKYSAALYCETIEGWFFASAKVVNVTAPDNGGKPVSMALTFKKAIDVVKNNDVVLNLCGKLAEHLAVPYSRVTDAYGGYKGKKSASLPASTATKAAAPAATKNATATKTRMLNATANKTVQTEWVVNLFVQPDPFAKTVDNAAVSAKASSTAAVTAMSTVTTANFGPMTAKATVVSEVAVKFVKNPTGTGGAKMVTIAGSTDVGGYVYCGVAKTPSRRMLNATANTTAKANATVAKKADGPVDLTTAAASLKYNVQRAETKANALTFSLAFKSL